MENKTSTLDLLLEKIETYGKTTLDLYKCHVASTTANVVSNIVSKIVFSVTILIFVFMVNIGAALWIGELFDKSYYGFFAVALFYLVLAIIIYFFRNELIKNPVTDIIIKDFMK